MCVGKAAVCGRPSPHWLVCGGRLLEGTVQDCMRMHADETVVTVEALTLVGCIASAVQALHDAGCAPLRHPPHDDRCRMTARSGLRACGRVKGLMG